MKIKIEFGALVKYLVISWLLVNRKCYAENIITYDSSKLFCKMNILTYFVTYTNFQIIVR